MDIPKAKVYDSGIDLLRTQCQERLVWLHAIPKRCLGLGAPGASLDSQKCHSEDNKEGR